MIGKTKISAVIPVYNECPHLEPVIKNIVKLKHIDEFICVNDGSTDKSLEVLEKYKNKINIVTYKKNRGKGYAVAQGIKIAEGELIILLDADITNYSDKDVFDMCNPIIEHELEFVVGLFPSRKEIVKIKAISGIRVYKKAHLVPLIEELESSTKYGIEPILNVRLKHLKHDHVWISRLDHISKYQKYDTMKSINEYAGETKSLINEYIRIATDE